MSILRTGAHPRVPVIASLVRIITGVLFVYFGIPKFTDHAGWVAGFGTFGLPESSLLVYATGAVEVLGGIALAVAAGGAVGTRIVAGVLALTMVGATVFGGLVGGSTESLVLAPALLLACGVVAWTTAGPAQRSTQRRRSIS
ncbi:DoxX family protein [Pseudonocardia nematodicida]|uniref:DoxX family protein n=1 Tax=Pseudonocardia nematodicida TaxID=1206997 RepID=A0ABV1K8D4_9PSEU